MGRRELGEIKGTEWERKEEEDREEVPSANVSKCMSTLLSLATANSHG